MKQSHPTEDQSRLHKELLSAFVERVALPEASAGRLDHAGPESHTTWIISHPNPPLRGKSRIVTRFHDVTQDQHMEIGFDASGS